MAGTASELHDALLASMPDGASHENCPLCLAAAAETAKEEADVATDEGRTFTEAEHFALLTDAVRRETAELESAKEALLSEKAELMQRVDVLEAEKAALTTERDSIKSEYETFKAELAAKEEIAARQEERLAKVKAAAEHLPEDYFTPERAARWAEMTEEAFEVAIADLAATKPATGSAPVAPETAAFRGGESPSSPENEASAFGSFLRGFRGAK